MPKGLKKHPLLVGMFLFALVLRLYFEAFYVDFGMDKGHQLFITQCFAEGEGFSYFTASLSDLSTNTAQLNRFWAVGWPFLVAGIDVLVGDLVLSSVLLDLAGVCALLWGFHLLLTRLQVGGKGYGLFMLLTGLTFTPYYYCGSTDFLSAVLWVLAIALTLEGLAADGRSVGRFAAVGLLVFLACFLRYAYYPFLVIIPGFLGAVALLRRDRKTFLGGAIVFAFSVVPMVGLLLFYQQYFGKAFLVKGVDTWFPHHLLRMAPFPLDTVVYTRLLEENLHALWPSLTLVFRVGGGALSLAILGVLARHALGLRGRAKDDAGVSSTLCFYGLLFLTLAGTVALFSYYSLKNPTPALFPPGWTYVEDNRYYVATILLLQVALVAAFFQSTPRQRFIRWGAGLTLGMGLLFAGSYGAYRFARLHFLGVSTLYDSRYGRISELVELVETLQSEGQYVVHSNGYRPHDNCMVALRTDARIVLDYPHLIAEELKTSAPLVLLVTMPKEKRPHEQRFLARYQAQRVIDRERFDTWRIDLAPGEGQ